MDTGKEERNMGIAIPRYNIRDFKKFYSELNNMALKGLEVITFKKIIGSFTHETPTKRIDFILWYRKRWDMAHM